MLATDRCIYSGYVRPAFWSFIIFRFCSDFQIAVIVFFQHLSCKSPSLSLIDRVLGLVRWMAETWTSTQNLSWKDSSKAKECVYTIMEKNENHKRRTSSSEQRRDSFNFWVNVFHHCESEQSREAAGEALMWADERLPSPPVSITTRYEHCSKHQLALLHSWIYEHLWGKWSKKCKKVSSQFHFGIIKWFKYFNPISDWKKTIFYQMKNGTALLD